RPTGRGNAVSGAPPEQSQSRDGIGAVVWPRAQNVAQRSKHERKAFGLAVETRIVGKWGELGMPLARKRVRQRKAQALPTLGTERCLGGGLPGHVALSPCGGGLALPPVSSVTRFSVRFASR